MDYKMKMPIDKFRAAVQKYVFEQVIPKVDGVGAQFLLGACYGVAEPKIGAKLAAFGATDEDGNVDLAALDRAVGHGFKACGGKACFSVAGHKFIFRPEDWQTFKRMC